MMLSMVEPKKKLARLEQYLPDEPHSDLLYEFGRYLSAYLNDRLTPMGFVVGCTLALCDLQSGSDGFTHQPIESWLIDYPPIVYTSLRAKIPNIAEAIFLIDFAAEVKVILEHITA